MEIDRSSLIVSKAGRDKGQLFFVIDADEQYVYLADGKSRKLEKPKRKKRKHVQAAFQTESRIAEKIRNGEKVLNSELRKELASLRHKHSQNQGGYLILAKDDVIELEGIVTDALPNAMFSVDIGGGHTILAHISGKLRMNFIKILPGDKVTVQMSPYDLTRGRITWRSK